MRAYTIFDDFPQSVISYLEEANIQTTVHPAGVERPRGNELKELIENYDILFVSTGQEIPESYFENISEPRIIGTASIGIDHIHVPEVKKKLIKIVNAPTSNRISVAEHTFALILSLEKCLKNGVSVAECGLNKKEMDYTPSDLYGKSIGVVGAGGTARAVIKIAHAFGMKCLCWTCHPEKHIDLLDDVSFMKLDDMLGVADVISVNLPLTDETKGLIDCTRIKRTKENAVFISLSRPEIIDNESLFLKAKINPTFRVGLDVDADKVYGLWNQSMSNVIVTPHIGGGTSQSRVRMFEEVSQNVVEALK